MAHEHGLAERPRLTRNQGTVLEVLRGAPRPMSAYQILSRTADAGLKAPPQIYRALQKLLELGMIHRVETLNAYLCCDRGPHCEEVSFAICEHCGAVAEVPLPRLASALRKGAAAQGFSFHDARIEIHGACGDCAGKSA